MNENKSQEGKYIAGIAGNLCSMLCHSILWDKEAQNLFFAHMVEGREWSLHGVGEGLKTNE